MANPRPKTSEVSPCQSALNKILIDKISRECDIPSVAKHRLNINPKYPLVQQKKRRFSLERNKIVSDEIDRLLEIDTIKPCQYPN